MKRSSRYQNIQFWIVAAMLIVAITVGMVTFLYLYPAATSIGPISFQHWTSIIGASILAVLIPVYYFLKRHYPRVRSTMLKIHVFTNLFAFQLITIHFSFHYSSGFNPVTDTGTGLLLDFVVALLVATGIMKRFQFASSRFKTWRFLHLSLTITFYLILVRHILRGLRIV